MSLLQHFSVLGLKWDVVPLKTGSLKKGHHPNLDTFFGTEALITTILVLN